MRYPKVMLAAVAALSLPAALAAKDMAVSPAITKALADPARADQASDDARRKAGAVIAFAGVKPGMTVVDYLPGQGYWTRIFTGVVGPAGRIYAYWPQAMAARAAPVIAKIDALGLANVTAEGQATNLPVVPAPVDLFWTVENYHDVANIGADGDAAIASFNKAVFAALKPGGLYVVIDHADAVGKGISDTKTLHRIDPAIVKKQVLAAGFTWAGESDALRNPADDHSLKVFDPAIRGHTDQFVYKFRKPK